MQAAVPMEVMGGDRVNLRTWQRVEGERLVGGGLEGPDRGALPLPPWCC